MEKTNKPRNQKFVNFIRKNLYLILMIVCVIAIATMVAVTYALKQKNGEDAIDVSITETPTPDVPVNDTPANDTPVDTNPSDPTPVATEEEVIFSLPLAGETVGVFANDTLVYNAPLNQWATHEAYDVAAETGTEVKCVYGGKVESITTSVLRGTEVVVLHENGMKTVYSLLGSDVSVTVGQTVKKGDVIGKIAETGTFEKHKGPHLHLEVWDAAGEKIDPVQFFESSDK
ncbi:MAG: M23 family metallopeptidase [Clostridia bacterium]|nr:M23 family metallopeptidase [Clostridia bacterium]